MKRNGKSYTKIFHAFTWSDRFSALPTHEKLLWYMLAGKYNGRNNGAIPLSVTEAARWMRCSREKAWQSFNGLQEKGLIRAVNRGSFDYKASGRKGRATEWYVAGLEAEIIDLATGTERT